MGGPQTKSIVLGGAQALPQSGAIRFLSNQPSLTTYAGQVRAEWGTTEYGGPSHEAGAAVGGPIVTLPQSGLVLLVGEQAWEAFARGYVAHMRTRVAAMMARPIGVQQI